MPLNGEVAVRILGFRNAAACICMLQPMAYVGHKSLLACKFGCRSAINSLADLSTPAPKGCRLLGPTYANGLMQRSSISQSHVTKSGREKEHQAPESTAACPLGLKV